MINLLKFIKNLLNAPQKIEVLEKNISVLKKSVEIDILNSIREILYSIYFHDSISKDSWFESKGLRLKDWAIGYPAAYIIYHTLNEVQPKSILELGLGQSTVITGIYAEKFNASHVCVEHDKDWASFFLTNNKQNLKNTKIVYKNILNRFFNGFDVLCYDNLYNEFKNIKFELIIIDGPFGSNGLSRIDIIDLVPFNLSEQFAIILDDTDREGEYKTLLTISNILNNEKINHVVGHYGGLKKTSIICSQSLKYLTTL